MIQKPKTWKTLGLSTQTRLWVTVNTSFNKFEKTLIKPLTLTGQSFLINQKFTKMSFWQGRAFSTLRLMLQGLIIYLIVKFVILNLVNFIYLSFVVLTATKPEYMLWFFVFVALIANVAWYTLLKNENKFASFFGVIGLVAFSLAVTLLKTLSTFGVKFPMRPHALVTTTQLDKFANAPKVTHEQKLFVVLAYRSFSNLINLEPWTDNTLPLPSMQYTNITQFAKINRLPLQFLALPSLRTIKTWPNITSDKLSLLQGRTLLLYHWQNLQSEVPNSLRSQSLWHAHRFGDISLGLAKLSSVSLASPKAMSYQLSNKTNEGAWLLKLKPYQQITTVLLNTQLAPVRYDLTQSLTPQATAVWFRKTRIA